MDLSRRSLLTAGITSALALGASPKSNAASLTKLLDKLPQKPKNIIFCVSDGMSDQIIAMADQYQQTVYGRNSYYHELLKQEGVNFAVQETRSLNSIVTDSSAAASTWGCGRRIWNGMVNCYPDKTMLHTLTEIMTDAGVRAGLVTTTTITHATPSGFSVSNLKRDDEAGLALKHLTSNVDILMGGGNRYFAPDKRADKRDLYAEFAAKGYKVVRTRNEVLNLKAKRILGIFSDSHTPYTVDRNQNPELQASTPTLAEMAKVAIENLKDSPKGFILQIEGGRVDHGAHGNDLAAALFDQIAFEEAVKVAIDFAAQDGETLVIITADHATGGPSLNGDGQEYIDSTYGLLQVQRMTCSYDGIWKAAADKKAASYMAALEEKYSIKIKQSEAEAIEAAAAGKSPLSVAKFSRSVGATLAQILGNYTRVTWTSGNHTSEHVWLTSFGPGSELIRGVVPNWTLHAFMLELKDLKDINPPQMNFAEAKKAYEKLRAEANVDFQQILAENDDAAYYY
jgi:alkaline phosphatase